MNVDNDLSLFDAIVPCGVRDFGVTRMARAGVGVDPGDVRTRLTEALAAECPCAPAGEWSRTMRHRPRGEHV